MKTVICRIDLGMTRIAGYTLYDEKSREFQETTPKEVKNLIISEGVNGLRLIDEKIELDKDGFNMYNLMIKSAVGKFRTLYPNNSMISSTYAVVRLIQINNGNLYEIISNKCARFKVTAERLKILMEVGCVAGVKKVNNKIEICNGVTIEDKRTKVSELKEKTETEVKESGQGLKSINTAVKTMIPKNNEIITSVGKSSSVDAKGDSIHTKVKSENTSSIHDNAEKNKKNNQPKGQVIEEKLTNDQNVKKR